MSAPCDNCPFRTDIRGYLRPGRVREIANSLFRQQSFPCHKTTVPDGDDELTDGPNSQQCAGAEIFLAKQGMSTQMSRIAGRLGLPVAELDMDAPVCGSLRELLKVHRNTEPENADVE
jgi:hypothetical protein